MAHIFSFIRSLCKKFSIQPQLVNAARALSLEYEALDGLFVGKIMGRLTDLITKLAMLLNALLGRGLEVFAIADTVHIGGSTTAGLDGVGVEALCGAGRDPLAG